MRPFLLSAVLLLSPATAVAQDGFRDPSLHAEHHHIYKNLHNQMGTHCCPIGDCRPTRAKYEDGNWYAMVNGEWRLMEPSRFVQEYLHSWSDTPHVCEMSGYVFCFVRPNAGF